ncbi:MAG TPA: glycosyltransferase [Propionibacteriaceae bacterium]|jgi:colanic acid biosynthesis glycosyl transferase WcaI
MRVLIIGINYHPEPTGIGPYTAGLAEHLAARGDEVTVLTGLPNYPGWRLMRGAPRRLIETERLGGVTVIRAAHYVPARQTAVKRALYEGTFGLTGLIASLRLQRPDAILGVVPSLSGGILARLTGQRLRARYGLLFQDLIGPAARQSGISGGDAVARATSAAEAWAAAESRAIGIVAESFAPYVASLGAPAERIHHVPNWSRLVRPSLSRAETRRRFEWPDDIQVVLHAGNIGLKQGLEQVVDAARLAADCGEPVRFVLAGDGSQAGALRAMGAGLPTLGFLPIQPEGLHASLLAAADVLLLSERATQLDMSLPSKLTSYFAAGRPIVAAVPLAGASAREVERAGAGVTVPAGNPGAILDALVHLRTDDALAARLAAAGPPYADANLGAAACLARAATLVDAIARVATPTPAAIRAAA